MASSSRSRPFSLSPDARAILGDPIRVNHAVRQTLPSLFDGSVDALLHVTLVEPDPPRASVRPGCHVPSGTPLGLFTGHIFSGPDHRGDHYIVMPPVPSRGGPRQFGVDAAAALMRFPSPTQAGMYAHACMNGTLRAEWRHIDHDPPFSVLVALADGPFHEHTVLSWNFDLHSLGGSYTLGDDDGQDWCAYGGAARDCDCNAPHDCPLGRVLRASRVSAAVSEASDDWTP